MRLPATLLPCALALQPLGAQGALDEAQLKRVENRVNGLDWELDALRKAADDQLWFQRLSEVALVDKVTYTGPPNPRDQEAYGIKNERHPLKIKQYVLHPPQGRARPEAASDRAAPRGRSRRFRHLPCPHRPGDGGARLHRGGAGIPGLHGLWQGLLRGHRLRRAGDRRRSGRPRLGRGAPACGSQALCHGGLEPRRPHRPHGGLRPSREIRRLLRRGACLRPPGPGGLRRRGIPGRCGGPDHVRGRAPARTWTSCGGAARYGTSTS